ncbi:MAG: hypothetical protein AAGI17_01970 [Planctomycetota bacterium]
MRRRTVESLDVSSMTTEEAIVAISQAGYQITFGAPIAPRAFAIRCYLDSRDESKAAFDSESVRTAVIQAAGHCPGNPSQQPAPAEPGRGCGSETPPSGGEGVGK